MPDTKTTHFCVVSDCCRFESCPLRSSNEEVTMKATAAKPEKTIEKKKCVVCPALTLGWGNVRGGVVCSKECNEAYYKNLYRRAS